mgnify:CR=1 FL=1
MAWLIFATETDAQAAELQIRANVRAFAEKHVPARLSPDGGLIGINAATGELCPGAALTTAWAIPSHVVEGWAIPLPSPDQIHPMLLAQFLAGVGGIEVADVTPIEPGGTTQPTPEQES